MPDHEFRLCIWWKCRSDGSRSPSPVNSHSDPLPASTRSLTWILLLVYFIISMVLAVIYYLSNPKAPQFTIHSVTGINFRDSCPWSITSSIRNPDKLVKFSYRRIAVSVSDATTIVFLSSVEIPPLILRPKSEIFVFAKDNAGTTIENGKSSEEKTTEHQWTGSGSKDPTELVPGVTLQIHCDVWAGSPVLPTFLKRKVDVECREVLMSMDSPMVCSTSLSNIW